MEEQFSALEEAQGGDGNGIALLGEGGGLIKGMRPRITPFDLALAAVEHGGPIIFHTRSASIGPACDELCQPFRIGEMNPVVVAHNGHWPGYKNGLQLLMNRGKIKYVPVKLSDSLVGAWMAKSFGPGTLKNFIDGGVWLYSKYNSNRKELEVFAFNNGGSLVVNLTTNQVASQPQYWRTDDEIARVCQGSVLQLWPQFKILSGKLIDWQDGMSKKEKKHVRREMQVINPGTKPTSTNTEGTRIASKEEAKSFQSIPQQVKLCCYCDSTEHWGSQCPVQYPPRKATTQVETAIEVITEQEDCQHGGVEFKDGKISCLDCGEEVPPTRLPCDHDATITHGRVRSCLTCKVVLNEDKITTAPLVMPTAAVALCPICGSRHFGPCPKEIKIIEDGIGAGEEVM